MRLNEFRSFRYGSDPREWCRTTVTPIPYCIGVTGGIASGKSSVAKYLSQAHGLHHIDCDVLGHAAYFPGTAAYDQVIAAFGNQLVGENGAIDRKVLGSLVFGSSVEAQANMQRLTSIVWPEIGRLLDAELRKLGGEGVKVCVVEAAVLLEANWQNHVDEVWVAVVPEGVACERIMERNKLSQEDAIKRIRSQLTNRERIPFGNTLIDTTHAIEVTRQTLDEVVARTLQHNVALPALDDSKFSGPLGVLWRQVATSAGASAEWRSLFWRQIRDGYNQPHRRYHTLTHISSLAGLVDQHRGVLERPDLVLLAVFFHDVVYDPTRSDNEEVSAEWFRRFANQTSLSPQDVDSVCEWIVATKSHWTQMLSGDGAVFLDMDVAILGSAPERYAVYSENIRLEYGHVSLDKYCSGRAQFLGGVLSKGQVFHTELFRSLYHEQALVNINSEIEVLRRWSGADQ
eukprot:c16757_g1_i3.p1 GENE.c16757_g1_i3~~c16757_g1_i3.p1  ORF type:complete len:457 (+),score=110.14 c16757_g1_i3:1214-2584(+)